MDTPRPGLQTLLAPRRLSGRALRSLAVLARQRPIAAALRTLLGQQLGIDALARLPAETRGAVPWDARPLAGQPPRRLSKLLADPPPASSAAWPRAASAFTSRYREGATTPREITEWALKQARAYAERSAGRGPIFVYDDARARADADASTRRWATGRSLGPLDGVVTVIKEESDVRGLANQVGTTFRPATPAAADAACVGSLRAAGAILLGLSPMTELGMSPLGVNPHRAMPRNPHAEGHLAGGSSTGSAVAVAIGLCPVAHAADGGGSIRIPASLCGVFGLKPTFGRVSRVGDAYSGTMNHLGPIAASVADLAAFLDAVAGRDDLDSATFHAPPLEPGTFARAITGDVRGLRIGLVEALWEVAAPAVATHGRRALAALERAGATLVPVSLPLANESAAIGYLSIGLEELADLAPLLPAVRAQLGPDLALSMAALAAFDTGVFLDAQRLRSTLRTQLRTCFATIDLLALPSTTITAPAISDAEAASSISDAAALHGVCRTMMLANLGGLPAASAPVGRDGAGLPIGLQLVGDAWDEATVLAALAALERSGAAVTERPRHTVEAPPGFDRA